MYDALGRPIQTILPDGATTTFEYSRPSYTFDPDNATTPVTNGGARVKRLMPGGLKKVSVTDDIGRPAEDFLLGGDSTDMADTDSPGAALGAKVKRWTRGYSFYAADDTAQGHFPGQLAGFTDALGRQHAFTYDNFGVLTGSTISVGPDVELINTARHDHVFGASTTTTLTQETQDTSITTSVVLTTDLLGQLRSEQVRIGNEVVSDFAQVYNAAGQRTNLDNLLGKTPEEAHHCRWPYRYHSDGQLAATGWDPPNAATTPASYTHTYDYDRSGLLTQRDNPFRTHTITSRDLQGRVLTAGTAFKGASTATVLAETLTWTNDSLQDSYTAQRSADSLSADAFNDVRDYAYATASRRLTTESWTAHAEWNNPSLPSTDPGAHLFHTTSRTTQFEFDHNLTGRLGIRTLSGTDAATGPLSTYLPGQGHWVLAFNPTSSSSGVDWHSRVTKEISGMERASLLAYGAARGAKTVSLSQARWKDGEPGTLKVQPLPGSPHPRLSHQPGTKAGQGNWEAPLSLPTGVYNFHASATHPSGVFTAQNSLSHAVNAGELNLTNVYDDEGQTTTRSFSGQGFTRTQHLAWDPAGRLIGVTQTESTGVGYRWSAIYDPLGRRIRTAWVPTTGIVPNTAAQVQQTSSYDPLVEFLEIGVHIQRGSGSTAVQERWWKVHGPDLAGGYGGLHGIGGLEKLVQEGTGRQVGLIDDTYGHIVGFGHKEGSAPATFEWNQARYGGYGPLPGHWAPSVEDGPDYYRTLGWRGRRIDATGFYHLGARPYDPASGRFLSPDPLGHSATVGLYAYAGGDPINWVDPTGRLQAAQQIAGAHNTRVNAVSEGNFFYPGGILKGSYTNPLGDPGSIIRDFAENMLAGGSDVDRYTAAKELYDSRIAQNAAAGQIAHTNHINNVVRPAIQAYNSSVGEQFKSAAYQTAAGVLNFTGFSNALGWEAGTEKSVTSDGRLTTGFTTEDISGGQQILAMGGIFVGGIVDDVAEGVLKARRAGKIDWLEPMDIKFSQPMVSSNFSSKGTLQNTIDALKSGAVKVTDIPVINVVEVNGVLYTLDNRRLVAFQAAGINSIPVRVLSLSDPKVANEFRKKFNPINGW